MFESLDGKIESGESRFFEGIVHDATAFNPRNYDGFNYSQRPGSKYTKTELDVPYRDLILNTDDMSERSWLDRMFKLWKEEHKLGQQIEAELSRMISDFFAFTPSDQLGDYHLGQIDVLDTKFSVYIIYTGKKNENRNMVIGKVYGYFCESGRGNHDGEEDIVGLVKGTNYEFKLRFERSEWAGLG